MDTPLDLPCSDPSNSVIQNALEIQGLGKAYRLYHSPLQRAAETLTFGRIRGHREVWALRDINFSLPRGSALGICGANGAGKTTLLRVLGGITTPTSGRFRLNGSVSSILDLGAGFHPAFSGRENIKSSCLQEGTSRKDLASKMGEIIEFAELGSAIDDPLRTYSSGMGFRLGFSLAVAINPAVLLIDEIFAVGDMAFQRKCVDKILEFRKHGKTILFCSHSLFDLRQMCDQAIWIRDGEVVSQGDTIQVTNDYTTFQQKFLDAAGEAARGREGPDGGHDEELPRIMAAKTYALGTDTEVREIKTGDAIEIRIWWENPAPEKFPIHLVTGLLRQDKVICTGIATHMNDVELVGASGCTSLRLPNLNLLAGQYMTPVWLQDGAGIFRFHEFVPDEVLLVRSEAAELGVFLPEYEWVNHGPMPLPD